MTYHVIIQPQAEAEIEAAYLWKRDNAPQAAARWFAGIVEAINPTTTLTHKSFYFNKIQHFYVKCFDSFYCHNPLKFKCLSKPCISTTYLYYK
jgi:hypothetical protein